MSHPAPQLAYAPDHLDHPTDRLLRRIIAFSSILYAGSSLIQHSLHVALAKHWLAPPPNMSFALGDTFDILIIATQTLAMAGLLLAGVLLLKRHPSSILLLRITTAFSISQTFCSLFLALHGNSIYASYWTTPATLTLSSLQFLQGLALPTLLLLLTLPHLARRMV